jgi:hypothetical protein
VHDIVTSNGGLIHVESAPSRGTRVSVMLPLVPAAVLNTRGNDDLKPARSAGVLIPTEQEDEE